jgi:hypothetical protein
MRFDGFHCVVENSRLGVWCRCLCDGLASMLAYRGRTSFFAPAPVDVSTSDLPKYNNLATAAGLRQTRFNWRSCYRRALTNP